MVTQIKDKDAPSQKALGQHLYEKNVALGDKIRKSVQGKLPTDPAAWQQMRENFEAIILQDPSFSAQNNIEDALWRMHYKRIEEFRARISHAAVYAKSAAPSVNDPEPASYVTKIRSQLKAFLSEATGFYHDLMMKLRDRYGLPVSYFSEEPLHLSLPGWDTKNYAEMKKGLVSCHRCLICLGDLARYKIMYENEPGTRDYAVASSYYLQASSIWPSSGHPHHQNRHMYLQLPSNRSSSTVKGSKQKVRGKVEARRPSREKTKVDDDLLKRTGYNEVELFKSFCIRFVRLNGIIFTRLSLETFAEVLSLVSGSFKVLLSYGPEEKLNFGKDAGENGLLIVRLVAILIFTVHNINNTTKDHSQMQRQVFLQNACTAMFQLMGMVFRRCTKIRDTCSSYLLPGILVFLEWLASCPDVASGINAGEAEANARLIFWNHHVEFLNKLLSTELLPVDDAENAFIQEVKTLEDGEIRMHPALWEDFELRGYFPLLASQMHVEYSRQHAFGGDEFRAKKARVERILEASKALAAVVKVKGKELCFDPEVKRFIIGLPSIPSKNKSSSEDIKLETNVPSRALQSQKPFVEEEDEDEVIVFKPNPLRLDTLVNPISPLEGLPQNECYVVPPFTSDDHYLQDLKIQNGDPPVSSVKTVSQHVQPVRSSASEWSVEQQASFIGDIISLGFLDDEPLSQSEIRGDNSCPPPSPHMLIQQSITATEVFYSPTPTAAVGNGGLLANLGEKVNDLFVNPSHETLTMNPPVSRPTRHHGPPPGFGIPQKLVGEPIWSDRITGKIGMLHSDRLGESIASSIGLRASSQVGWRDQYHQGRHQNQEQQFPYSNSSFAPMPSLRQGKSGSHDWYPF
uniref:Telomerase activating protein Est1 n=1 Tax=Kalanchoe fedtschenkoi TaxID=63787 RepID=A0A7N0TIG9_KALFE